MPYVIDSIEGNRQRLDGGAMFGNVPRVMWEKWIRPDALHRIELACRAFLIHDTERDRRILLETGIGVFFEPKLRARFGVFEPEHRLLENLARMGIGPEAIDVVVLSHLHFDHAGGLVTPWEENTPFELLFPRAHYVIGERAWARAHKPHVRDRASFIPDIIERLDRADAAGRVERIGEEQTVSELLGPDFSFTLSDGHTPGLVLTTLRTDRGAVVFCGDLIPGSSWIHLPITMGYDRFPERLIDEKQRFLTRCLEQRARLLLTHDPSWACCTVRRDERGRFRPAELQPDLGALTL